LSIDNYLEQLELLRFEMKSLNIDSPFDFKMSKVLSKKLRLLGTEFLTIC